MTAAFAWHFALEESSKCFIEPGKKPDTIVMRCLAERSKRDGAIKMNHHDIVRIFREENLFSKEDILCSLEMYMDFIEEGEEENTTESIRRLRINLCKKFIAKLEKCKLPRLTELWRFYTYDFMDNRIDLNLCSAKDVKCEEDGCLSQSTKVEHTLVTQKCDYLSVDEFAEAWGVKPATVLQWIRRGKLRTAKIVDDAWLIPELENKPGRTYRLADYLIESGASIEVSEFPLVAACDNVVIIQNTSNKKLFTCIFRNYESDFCEEMELNREEVESLEYALISSGKTEQGSRIQFIPTFERM